jgi:hypothetical protein
MSSDSAKPRATALPNLDWQGELDSAMADLDSRLTHPRRRAGDLSRAAVLPEVGQVQMTTELLDEIAWRVAENMRRNGEPATAEGVGKALSQPEPHAELRPGKMLMIRFKLPLLPWPFRLLQRRQRKKQHPLTTARL